jgi:hypothetical protein
VPSTPPGLIASMPPAPLPSPRRALFAKLTFALAFSAAVALLAYALFAMFARG